jgi:hypothetical protein
LSPWQKTAKVRRIFLALVRSIDRYNRFSVNRWIDDHRSENSFMIDCRYYRSNIKKSLADRSITSIKMRPKVSIDTIDRYHRYRSIDPSPIVAIYGVLGLFFSKESLAHPPLSISKSYILNFQKNP